MHGLFFERTFHYLTDIYLWKHWYLTDKPSFVVVAVFVSFELSAFIMLAMYASTGIYQRNDNTA